MVRTPAHNIEGGGGGKGPYLGYLSRLCLVKAMGKGVALASALDASSNHLAPRSEIGAICTKRKK